MSRTTQIALAVAASLAAAAPAALADSIQGPSSSQTPYVVTTAPGWSVTSLLTVGDSPRGGAYPMVGIPDGLGAVPGRFDSAGRYLPDPRFMTVLMNHELGTTAGIARAHGTRGAFVSQWTIELKSLAVTAGSDLIERVYTYQDGAYADTTGTATFARFCSGDLPSLTAFFNPLSGKGFPGLIYMNGEEAGNEGRAFAHVATGRDRGTSWELPYLGKFSWENSVAHPYAGDRTIVVGLDDSTPGQVYVYAGDKRRDGSPVERAGLAGGKLYGIRVDNGGANYGGTAVTLENGGAIDGTFKLVEVSDAALQGGAALQSTSVARGITEFARPEDGAWDPRNPRVFYWVTTGASVGGATQTARLYRLTFDSVRNPTGGRIELVVDSRNLVGTDLATARSFDNVTVDGAGNVIVQEDPGNSPYIAKTWKIDPRTGAAEQFLESDRSRFSFDAPNGLTDDEENSGVIEVTDIVRFAPWYERGRRYYLGDMQAHYPNGLELVEGGQLYLVASPKQ